MSSGYNAESLGK